MVAATKTSWLIPLYLAAPSLEDNTADANRLLGALSEALDCTAVAADLNLMRAIPEKLRAWGYRARCVVGRDHSGFKLCGMCAPDDDGPVPGLAIDLGTTRIALRLLDLAAGDTMAELTFDNPQSEIGPDILTRIHHAAGEEGLFELQAMLVDGLNDQIEALVGSCGLKTDQVHLAALAGNTAMTHLLLGLDPRWIIREPYIPVTNTPGLIRARDLGLRIGPSARLFVFPNVGSYFGGDLIAGILAADLHKRSEPALMVDVGTNAEVVLGNRDWLIGCAGAAGPALEGGVAEVGMTAGDGVIDRVWIESESKRLEFHVLGGGKPRGICGSGLIDLAACLFRSGRIDLRGRLVPDACADAYEMLEGVAHLVLVPAAESASGRDLTIGQHSLTSLKKAKAAMFTILETLTASVGTVLEDVSVFFVAGTFGSVIDPESAVTIGMLPDIPRLRFQVLGNSSLGGATRLMLNASLIDDVHAIRKRVTYLELNVNQDFMNRFSGAQFFPHTDPSRFPSVRVDPGHE
jgi:uncharacterized 2Fe-2S/4Fe-4S cluster protein (DUF4445 family)